MAPLLTHYDTIIIGAGAAGMMCAIEAAAGGRVLILDHAKAPGEKIRISGGGRCNFTNLFAGPDNFLSENPHFAKSALSRYTQYDFIEMVDRHAIPWHEKTLGQLFCDRSAKDIITMLVSEMTQAGAELLLETGVEDVQHADGRFTLRLTAGAVTARNLVVASGGKSIPKMGATGWGYRIAEQFGLAVTPTRPALVPFTFDADKQEEMRPLAGVSLPARAACADAVFEEGILFTHRGLSGPAILQISSYWREGEAVFLSLLPGQDVLDTLKVRRTASGARQIATVLGDLLPKRLADDIAAANGFSGRIGDHSDAALARIAAALDAWHILPQGTEGYRTAEVTLGGVDTGGLNARSMQAKDIPGLYFIGEVVDVTGWLGGYNFQWAWSSGWAAGQALRENGA